VDFRLGEAAESLRREVRAFLDEVLEEELEERLYRSGVSHDDAFMGALAERDWLAPAFPEEFGGTGRDAIELIALQEELQRADAPVYASATNAMIAATIARMGSDFLKQEILPLALRGEILIVLGFSEPEAGSDVASVQCKAVRDGDQWTVTGQKMFTTNGHIADYAYLLARTNPDVAKHKGLTMFLVPMRSDGVEVQAVFTLSGERTNITFYNDVVVPDYYRVGDVDQGWSVLTSTLQDEHSAGFAGHLARLVELVQAWARETPGPDGRPKIEDPDVRHRVMRAATELEVAILLQRRAVWMADAGQIPEAEGPMAKLLSTEYLERSAQDLNEMIGPDALRSYFEPTAPQNGRIEHILRLSLGTTIYAGTSEVQRNIIAQRGLGLPR
jgi:alkylation response protein AidB-like acyl-CoA dehydrogenase